MARAKRWSPGKGFVKLQEYGSVAVWMKALKDGALLAAYRPCWREGQEHLVEKWIIQLPRGTDFHWDILDKTHRIRWLLHDKKPEPGSTLWNVKILKYEVAGASHVERRAQPCRRSWGSWTRGDKHFRTWRRVRPWEGRWGIEYRGTLPRKIAAALQPVWPTSATVESIREPGRRSHVLLRSVCQAQQVAHDTWAEPGHL